MGHKVSNSCWKNGGDRLARHRIVTNFQSVQKAIPAKRSKVKNKTTRTYNLPVLLSHSFPKTHVLVRVKITCPNVSSSCAATSLLSRLRSGRQTDSSSLTSLSREDGGD